MALETVLASLLFAATLESSAPPSHDTFDAGPPAEIQVVPTPRSRAVVRAFRRANPCPATGHLTGACPEWNVDHKYPLCAGGADTVENMQWMPVAMKYTKDRLERELCALQKRCGL